MPYGVIDTAVIASGNGLLPLGTNVSDICTQMKKNF